MNGLWTYVTPLAIEGYSRSIVISFSGIYPPGSSGNEFAKAMREAVAKALDTFVPDAIILDFLDLEYSWGDGIVSQVLMPLYRLYSKEGKHVACCIIARDGTRMALEGLMKNTLLEILGVEIFEELSVAVQHLADRNGAQFGDCGKMCDK